MYLTTVLRRYIWCYLEANTCVSELPAKLPSLVVHGQKKKNKKQTNEKKKPSKRERKKISLGRELRLKLMSEVGGLHFKGKL